MAEKAEKDEKPRRSGRAVTKKLDSLDDSNLNMEELQIDDSGPGSTGGKGKKGGKKPLKNLKAKQDESSKFMTNFDPSVSRRTKQQAKGGRATGNSSGNVRKAAVYDNKGVIIQLGLDVCDCLEENCPGCHFPCPKCRSAKCGHECRANRKWQYDSVELDGIPGTLRNNQHLVTAGSGVKT